MFSSVVLTVSEFTVLAVTVPLTFRLSPTCMAVESSELKLFVTTSVDFTVPATCRPLLISMMDESSLCITLVTKVGADSVLAKLADPVTTKDSLTVMLVLSSELITLSVIRIFFNNTDPVPLGCRLMLPLVRPVVMMKFCRSRLPPS